MIDKIKQAWKTLFIANALPFIAVADKFNMQSKWVVIASLPGTIFTCVVFTVPIVIYQAWYEYRLYKKI